MAKTLGYKVSGIHNQRRKAMILKLLTAALLLNTSLALATGVCDRTPQVRDAIVAEAGESDCAQVTAQDLQAIGELDLDDKGISQLKAGDFAGLEALDWLYLGDNQLTSLPAGVFAGLKSLDWLYLGGNQLTSPPAGVFAGLEALGWLNLEDNQLTSLPAGVFADLPEDCVIKL